MKKNYRFMFVAAMAAMAAIGCSKENSDTVNGEDNSVRMTISGYTVPQQESRAEGPAVDPSSPEVTFNGGYIYFTSATQLIVKRVEITTTGASTGYNPTTEKVDIVDLAAGVDITNVPASATGGKVYIVGNVPTGITPPSINGGVGDIEGMAVAVATQADATGGVSNVSLYGEGSLVPIPATDDYKADISVQAVAARLELGKVTSKGNEIAKFRVDGLFINNYYSTMGLKGTAAAASLVDNGDDGDEYSTDAGKAYASLIGTLCDYSATGIGTGVADVTANESVEPSTGDVWAYNILAPTTVTGNPNPEAPRVVIRIDGIEAAPGFTLLENKTWYLTMSLIFAGSDQFMKPGYVYSIDDIEFEYTDLEENPEQGEAKVHVTATMIDWKFEGLNYSFGK